MAYKRICCPKCSDSFGQEARFIDHLTEAHGVSDTSQLYVDIFCNGNWPTCQCSVDCHEKIKFASWKVGFISKYVRGHNAKVDSIYLNADKQKEFAQKRRIGYAAGDYKVWNAGLTKKTDERVKLQSESISRSLAEGYSSGKIIDWRVGNEEKASSAAKKCSETKLQMYADGLLEPWNKGRTKFEDDRIKLISDKISQKYKNNPEMGNRIKQKKLAKRLEKYSNFTLISRIDSYKKRRIERLTFKCNKCEEIQEKSLAMLEDTPVCFSCHPKESKGQLQIYEFVKSLVPDAILSDRTVLSPKELDIWVPSANLGIEYNGLYWHSESNLKDKLYHQNKHEMCSAAGINLLSIYEDEWRDKRNIVEGMLRHRLKLPLEKWDARKLEVAEISHIEARNFFEANHLEGHVKSAVAFGLKCKVSGQILAALSLRRPFHKKYSGQLEAGRCCTLAGHSVRGWLGKLTKAAKNYAKTSGVDRLMTYVDSRVGSGNGYVFAGWRLIMRDTAPRFWWTDYKHRFNRFNYRADRIRGMSQLDVAEEGGVVQIWGCSNSMFCLDV